MATHFLARPVGDINYPTPVEEFTTNGNREVLVNPRTINNTDRDIEGVALLNIAGRQHAVALTHLYSEQEKENLNMIAYSYFLSVPQTGYSTEIRNIYKYINNKYDKQSTYVYYDFNQMVSDVDFSKTQAQGKWSDISTFDTFGKCFIIDFRTYVIFINEDGTIPTDTFENQVPYEVNTPPRPNWINSLYFRYTIEWSTENDEGTEIFESFNDFILAKQRYVNNADTYTSLSWRMRLYISANINDGLYQRGPETITINPVNIPSNIPRDPVYEIKKPKPLYLNLVQQVGYNTLTLLYQPAIKATINGVDYLEAIIDSTFGYWDVNNTRYLDNNNETLNPAYHDLLTNGNPVGVTHRYEDHVLFGDFQLNEGEKLGYVTLEFSNGTNYSNDGHTSFQNGSEWYYIGKPFFLGVKNEIPSESRLVWALDCGNQDENQNFFCRPHFSHMGLKNKRWDVYSNPYPEDEDIHPWLWQGQENSKENWCQVIIFPIWGKYNSNNQSYNPSETPTGPHSTLSRWLVNWLDKSYGMAKITQGDGGISPSYAGAISARQDIDKTTMAFNSDKTPTGSGSDRLQGTGQSFAQIWELATRGTYHFSEVLMVPILVTPRKLLTNDRVNTSGQGMCIGKINYLSAFKNNITNYDSLPDYLGIKISITYKDS